jgi:energy-coupling factor transporter ATP-binding protein EcfA2
MNTLRRCFRCGKTFTMHHARRRRMPVVANVFLAQGRSCAVLGGPSGAGKSSILKMLYGNYGRQRPDPGAPPWRHVDIASAAAHGAWIRRDTIGYVSQFLRAVPRVSALDVAAEPLLMRGVAGGDPGPGARAVYPAQPAGTAVVAAAGDLFGRRTAAGQHRPRLHHRPSGPAARRADGVARCRQPRGGDRA